MTLTTTMSVEAKVRHLAREMTPPVLLRALRTWRKQGLRFSHEPATWEEALQMSGGYDSQAILERVIAASRSVVAGKALFERDAVLFDQPDYPFPIIALLLRAAMLAGGTLSVLDFGGSLGSTYRQCRPMLKGIKRLEWCVVEQAQFVSAGRAEFETEELQFAESIEAAAARHGPDVVLLSSVLQYLPDPEVVLHKLAQCGAKSMVIDRTPFSTDDHDRLCVQHVPESIYPASYPCRLFSKHRFLQLLHDDWRVVAEFACPEGTWRTDAGFEFAFRGLALERHGP